MTENLLAQVMDMLEGLPPWLIVFIVSMLPVIELRGGIIAAALLKMPYIEGLIPCLIGNILPVPFILWLIIPVFRWLKKTKLFRPFVEKLEKKSMGKSDRIRKYEFWGLVLFVGIPLPGTGAWTGSLIAALLDVSRKKAVPAIVLGVLLAAAIMSFISYGIPYILTLF